MYGNNYGQENFGSGGDAGYGNAGGAMRRNGNLTTLFHHDYPGNHLLKISLCCDTNRKEYKSPFFFFVRCCPAGKNGNDSTYITDHHITFVMEYARFMAFASHLASCANGLGERRGEFKCWADTSKAAHKGENTDVRTSKALSVQQVPYKGRQGGAGQANPRTPDYVVNVVFNRGRAVPTQGNGPQGASPQQRGGGFDSICVNLSPSEAAALASIYRMAAEKAVELDMEHQLKKARQERQGQPQVSRGQERAA